MNFHLTENQVARLHTWLEDEVYPVVVEQQSKDEHLSKMLFTSGNGKTYPYAGAIGGDMTVSFTPTGLGTIVKVESWGHTIDLTEYDTW